MSIGWIVSGGVVLLVLILVWWVKGLTTKREMEQEDEYEALTGVIDVRRNTKDKLRDDSDYAERVRNAFNDQSG